MDQISEMIIKIKNAGDTGKLSVCVPFSKLKVAIAELLMKKGYIKSFSRKGKKTAKSIEMELLYGENKNHAVKGVKRISKLSKRVYQKSKSIKPVRYGHGTLVLSTPNGVVTGDEAKKMGVGGEVLFKIW